MVLYRVFGKMKTCVYVFVLLIMYVCERAWKRKKCLIIWKYDTNVSYYFAYFINKLNADYYSIIREAPGHSILSYVLMNVYIHVQSEGD